MGDRVRARRSPLQLTLLVALSVFVAETLVMVAVHALEPYVPLWVEFLLDATVLVVLVSPALFVFVFRPLAIRIEAQDRAEAELRRAQEALAERARASDEALAAVFQASPVPLVALTPEGNVSLWNQAAQAVFGWRADEVVNRLYPLVPPGREAEFRELLARALQGERLPGIEVRRQRKDGALLDLNVWTAPLHDAAGIVTGILAVVVDVTARRRAEERLRLQGAALEAAANAVMITDREGTILWANDAFSRLTGWSLDECRGRTPRILKSGRHDRLFYEELWRTILGARVWQHEMFNRRKDGELYIEDQTITPVTDERGEVTHFVAVKVDVTEKRRAERALKDSEERYRTLAEAAQDDIFILDPEHRIRYVNACGARKHRRMPAEVVGSRIEELFPPEVAARLCASADEVFATGRAVSKESQVAFPGGETWLSTSLVPLPGREGEIEAVMGIARDITERKHLEEQLRQAQKMEAVGHLAAGVAHDFNNLLSVIGGYSELVLRALPPDSPLRRRVEEIQKAGERAAMLTRQLLTFSRKEAIEPTLVDVAAVVAGMEGMLRRLVREDVQIVTVQPPRAASVNADRGHIEQVILNLAVNARDAMPSGGRLVIETSLAELDPDFCRGHVGVVPGPYVELAVSDTGAGMDAETQAHIFEPFFTTKEPGKGTGLGLATVYGIVRQWGGTIWAYSEPGHGTTFKIYLPLAEGVAAAAPPPGVEPATGSETILLVEDEPALREVASEVLCSFGYTVLEARDGLHALEVLAGHTGPIHLLLTDVVMPGLSGRELSERLLALRPEVRVLFTSGYTGDALGAWAEGALLQKPYSSVALARKVRQSLDAAR